MLNKKIVKKSFILNNNYCCCAFLIIWEYIAKQAKDRGVDYDAVKKEFEEEGVIGRWAKAEEIATGILFLATDDSSYMTGADLRLDGGWTTK